MSISTTSSNSANLYLYYVKKLLKTLQPRLQLYKLGKKTTLPKGFGTQVKWLIYTKVSSSTSPLSEGVPPSSIQLTSANITSTIAQYGQYAQVSDLLDMTAIDPVIESFAELFGRAGAETVEDLCAAQLDSTLTTQFANGEANLNAILATDVITMKEFLSGSITLKEAFVGPHEMGSYMAVLHPANEYDIMVETNVGGWLDVNSYQQTDKENIIRGEIGKVYGIRFLVSDKMTAATNSGSVSCKNNYLLGEECFGVVELGGKTVDMVIKPIGSAGAADPLNQFGTVGYKLQGFAVKTLQSNRGLVIKGASNHA